MQLYLKLDRPDLAEKALKAMTAADDESALTQLCTALLCLAQVRAAAAVPDGKSWTRGSLRDTLAA